MFVKHRMRAMIEIDPKGAARVILEAFRAEGAHRGKTAERIGCEAKALARWARQLGIDGTMRDLEDRAIAEGWHHGSKGGAGDHRDPEARARKASTTRRAANGERR